MRINLSFLFFKKKKKKKNYLINTNIEYLMVMK